MSSTYGERIKLSIFGQSHGAAIGMTLDGVPAGLPVDTDSLQTFLNRRAPGQNDYSTPRREEDRPEFLSGLLNGFTCGAPISAVIYNKNTRSGDYANLKDCPRPGHADYTAQVKYGGYQDAAGGGHFSGRLTAALCIAGGLCKQWLSQKGIHVAAHISSIAGITDEPNLLNPTKPDLSLISEDFPVINPDAGAKMREKIAEARAQGDSVGIGDPMFGGMESRIAQIVYGVPAVKGLEFGNGFSGSLLRGSENNDPFTVENGSIGTLTNHAGGILGGITTGMPLVFRAAIKPTPSISIPQQSISLSDLSEQPLVVKGRHDPCIVPRAVPVIEAAAAVAIFDAYLSL